MVKIPFSLSQHLKASLWHKVGTLVSIETQKLSKQHDTPINATPQFIAALTEMVWTQVENVAIDLEAFARHAGRTTVSTDDVLLIARRNEALEGVLKKWLDLEVKKGETIMTTKKSDRKGKGKSTKRS